MNHYLTYCLCLCVVLAGPAWSSAGAPPSAPAEKTALCLAENGKPKATIVLAKDATDLQRLLPSNRLVQIIAFARTTRAVATRPADRGWPRQ